jgi:hypothetical protein
MKMLPLRMNVRTSEDEMIEMDDDEHTDGSANRSSGITMGKKRKRRILFTTAKVKKGERKN